MRLGGCRKKRWAVALILLFFGLFLAQDWQEHGLFNDEAGRRSDCCRGNANSELSTIDVARFFFLPFFHSSSPAASQPCSQPLKPSRPLLTTLSLSRPLQAVLSTFGFHFIYSLTLIHTLTTLAGMKAFQAAGESDKSERARERGPRLLLLASFLPVFARSISLASLSLLLVFPPPHPLFSTPSLPPNALSLSLSLSFTFHQASTRRRSFPKRPSPRSPRPTSATSS